MCSFLVEKWSAEVDWEVFDKSALELAKESFARVPGFFV
jgi:hypothetical protein